MIQPHTPLRTHLGAEDNLRRVSVSEFESADFEEGLRYELIEGVLQVSPSADAFEKNLTVAVHRLIDRYNLAQKPPPFAEIVWEPRLFIVDVDDGGTIPEPDIAAYADYPPKPFKSFRGVFPVLVIEVVAPGGRHKDYVRNVKLYAQSPEVLEYWILDPTRNAARPTMTVFRRATPDADFERTDIPAGGVYECQRWPGLRVDLGRIAVD